MCSTISNQKRVGRLVSMVMVSNAIIIGSAATITLWITSGILWLGEKTTTNEKRYNERGMTQSNGMGVMSVVTKAVTPSIMLEGTNASPIHLSRLSSVGAPESPMAKEAPKAEPTSGEPPPAPTGGLGQPSPPNPPPSCTAGGAAGGGAGAERHSISAEAKTKTMSEP